MVFAFHFLAELYCHLDHSRRILHGHSAWAVFIWQEDTTRVLRRLCLCVCCVGGLLESSVCV